MSKMYVTYLERPDEVENYNRYDGYKNPYIIHNGRQWHFGRFPTMEKLLKFVKFAGLTIDLEEDKYQERGGMFRKWNIDCELNDHILFQNIKDIPKEAKAFTGLSNGSLVTCYLYNDGNTLHIYRPNPNAKNVYKPLSVEESKNYCRENGYC